MYVEAGRKGVIGVIWVDGHEKVINSTCTITSANPKTN